jgi:nitrite reductase/ring-hydroxylating ferredoxin subunit
LEPGFFYTGFGGIIITMDQSSWIPVIEVNKLKENSLRLVLLKGLPVLLVRKTADEIYALSNKCPHMACPLNSGVLEEYILKCPCHGWRFDIRTGEMLEAKEIKIPLYEWQIAGSQIWLKI